MNSNQSSLNHDIRTSPAPLNPIRILVTDDSENAANILGMFLRIEGYEVAVAYDGREAVEIASTFNPKLAFLDLSMPGLDGWETAKALRRLQPDLLLVALSGRDTEEDRQRTTDAGFDVHLMKPSKPADLRRALRLLEPQADGVGADMG